MTTDGAMPTKGPTMLHSTSLSDYFQQFRSGIVGLEQTITTPFGAAIPIVYADWTATGRAYAPIEQRMTSALLPMLANTHTETNATGRACTQAYQAARNAIRRHVNAGPDDVLITDGSGMTGVVNRLQRILGLRVHERFRATVHYAEAQRPVVFITHMEHHSNQVSWLETLADVVIVAPGHDGLVDAEQFRAALAPYATRPLKIAAVTACSNVTGLRTPYHAIARVMHEAGGYCFVDFASAAPYIDIDMHPVEPLERLDAIYFSPHKFLGGVGTPGILVFAGELYRNEVPDAPGGGTVEWTNPWGEHRYVDAIEAREDGGTPAFAQTIRAALCMQLKEQMGVRNIERREREITAALMTGLSAINGVHVLASECRDRLSIVSLYIEGLHHNLAVRMLNDRFGIQVRGGCSCAGTYGHYLLGVDRARSKAITDDIDNGDYALKPGWLRVSLHPTTTDQEVDFIIDAFVALAHMHGEWAKDYAFDPRTNNLAFRVRQIDTLIAQQIEQGVFAPLPTARNLAAPSNIAGRNSIAARTMARSSV